MEGPSNLEPTPSWLAVATKAMWWAHQDSNLEPKDSLNSVVSYGADYLFTLGITR